MKTINRPTASIEIKNHLVAMESQVRRLFHCEPLVELPQRQQLFERLADLDIRIERLSLRALTTDVDLDTDLLDDIASCASDLRRLERSWIRSSPSALGVLEAA